MILGGFRGQNFEQLKKSRKIGKKSSFYRILEKRSPETLDFTEFILPMKELFYLNKGRRIKIEKHRRFNDYIKI